MSKASKDEVTEAPAQEGASEPEVASEPAVEAPAEEATEPVAPYEAQIIDPVEPEPAQEQPEETQPEVPDGHVAIVYRGGADAFDHGAYQFRGGQPVIVPSDVAEELLTFPFERFERA